MTTMTPMTIHLPTELYAQARVLASTTGRTLDGVRAEAVTQGLAYDRWFRSAVREALDSTKAGRLAAPQDVEEMWNRLTTPEAMAEAGSHAG